MGVVLPLYAWFYLCIRDLNFVGVVLLLWAWYFLCNSGITSVCVVFASVGVVLPLRFFFFRRRGYDL